MADLEDSLRTFVLSRPEIAAVLGNRFVWNFIPGTMTAVPIVRGKTVDDAFQQHYTGTSGSKALVQLDVLDTSKERCNAVANLLKNLNGYTGVIGDFNNCRLLVKDAPSDWNPDIKYFTRTVEMDIGYA